MESPHGSANSRSGTASHTSTLIPLDEVWDALGSDTYLASFGRHESIPAVSRKHYQKAHIRLSGNAKQYIDKRLDTLFEQFGAIHYISAT